MANITITEVKKDISTIKNTLPKIESSMKTILESSDEIKVLHAYSDLVNALDDLNRKTKETLNPYLVVALDKLDVIRGLKGCKTTAKKSTVRPKRK